MDLVIEDLDYFLSAGYACASLCFLPLMIVRTKVWVVLWNLPFGKMWMRACSGAAGWFPRQTILFMAGRRGVACLANPKWSTQQIIALDNLAASLFPQSRHDNHFLAKSTMLLDPGPTDLPLCPEYMPGYKRRLHVGAAGDIALVRAQCYCWFFSSLC